MLCVRRNRAPLDYSKCNMTVTVYHEDSPGNYRKFEIHGAFIDFRKNQNVEKTGARESNSFLLVIPEINAKFGRDYLLKNGDKVLLGEGKDIASREEWARFIPVSVSGLVVVKYVDPKYFEGKLCHTEAGG